MGYSSHSSWNMSKKQVIAIAGVGGLGQYICEELSADDRFTVIVLTRQVSAILHIPSRAIQRSSLQLYLLN